MENFVVRLSLDEEELKNIIEPLLDSEGFELIRLTLKRSQAKSLLALFVDTKAQKNGIILENLEFISRFLSDVLDAKDEAKTILNSRYDLEVSTPGVDRPLTKARHFSEAVGERVKIRLHSAERHGTRGLLGNLQEALEGFIVLKVEGKNELLKISFEEIAEAHIVFDFTNMSKPKKKLN
ncbi:MAG: ribosome maturation factor RimP [Myxococcales bacterium]|nr:ribosome maturation factor RimP [Myxococcales bacterium]USN50778.1 MAG: ribosome maturation factor RimP [Myxococcales bacterium]